MRILGLDGGFANFGFCIADYDGRNLAVKDMGVILTKKSARRIPISVDNYRRAQVIGECLEALVLDETDEGVRPAVDCAASEAMSFPRHAQTAAKLSITWGIVAEQLRVVRVPLVQVTPQEVKIAVCGKRTASKYEMATFLSDFYPETKSMIEEISPSRQEHAWDALGAIVASLDSEVVKMGSRIK